MIRLITVSFGLALIASSAGATVYCNADGTPQGCVWERNPGVGAAGVGVAPGVGVGARGVGVEPGRDGVDGEINRGGPVNRAGRR